MRGDFVAFDCETSGLDPAVDSLLQLAAVRVHDGRVDGEFCTLVRYTAPLSVGVARLTGLSAEDLAVAPPLAEAVDGFGAFAGDLPLVAHNAAFDVGFLQAALRKCGLPPWEGTAYDTYALARLLAPLQPSFRLGELAARYGLALEQAHDALHDARATGLLFAAQQEALSVMGSPLLATLEFLQRPARDATWSLLAEALRERGGGLPQIVLAGARGGAGVAGAAGAEAVELPALPLDRFDPDALASALGPDGALAAVMPGFESRPMQVEMLRRVARAFAESRHLLVEAGTGTGKSLAYLLPALAWARASEQPVVVATHTINLQEQLIDKDIPLLARATGGPVRAALLKGRSHYLCLKTWAETLEEEPSPQDGPFLARIAAWLAETTTGDRGELDLFGEDEERWYALSTDAVACPKRSCPWFGSCFFFQSRARADASEIVVVNHALLLTDLKTGSRILPEHSHLVVDEAHHLDDEASIHLGDVLSERRCMEFLGSLDRRRGRGALGAVRRVVQIAGGLSPDGGRAGPERTLARLQAEAGDAISAAGAAFAAWRDWAKPRAGRGATGWATVRIEPRGDGERWAAVSEAGEALRLRLADLQRTLFGLAREVEDDAALGGSWSAEMVAELDESASRAGEYARVVQLMLTGQDGWVTWLEGPLRRGGSLGALTLRGAPIEPGPLLNDYLFGARESVVLTSATLTVGGSFQYLASRLGLVLDRERYDAVAMDSPFDFRDQALLAVVDDLPDVREPDAFTRGLTEFLRRLLTASGGRGLVLFTSNRMLRAVYGALKPALEAEGIAVLGQGLDGSRGRLTAALREGGATVVLGAASFWEGIDVPGEALSCVVVAQLPFWAPDIPLVQARSEALAASDGSPFRDLALPQAVLRFKQGFGRLIRTAGDRGVAVVCDRRLAKNDYGKVFRRSLPGPREFVGGQEQVLAQVRGFLGR